MRLILLLLITIIFSCGEGNGKAKQGLHSVQDTLTSKILIRSPGQCTHMIVFNNFGNCKLIFGAVRSKNYDEEFNRFDTIIKEASFAIGSKKDLDSLNLMIDHFQRGKLVTSKRPDDAFHYELLIGNDKKVDVYGSDWESLSGLINVLSKHLPFKIDYSCF